MNLDVDKTAKLIVDKLARAGVSLEGTIMTPERSREILVALGLPDWAIRYFANLGARTGRLPHTIVRDCTVEAVWQHRANRHQHAKPSDGKGGG